MLVEDETYGPSTTLDRRSAAAQPRLQALLVPSLRPTCYPPLIADQHQDDAYPPEKAQRRFEAAIRGARIADHRQIKDLPWKPRAKPGKARTTGVSRKSRRTRS